MEIKLHNKMGGENKFAENYPISNALKLIYTSFILK